MDHDDFVFIQGADGKMHGGGYGIENILTKTKSSPIMSFNQLGGGGGSDSNDNFSSILKNYAVPSFLFSFPYKNNSVHNRDNTDPDSVDLFNDDLYKKLVDIVSEQNIKKGGKKTRRTKIKISNTKSKKNI
jgi:hypothetical protein